MWRTSGRLDAGQVGVSDGIVAGSVVCERSTPPRQAAQHCVGQEALRCGAGSGRTAGVAKWVDAGDLKSPGSNPVWVRVPPPALGPRAVAPLQGDDVGWCLRLALAPPPSRLGPALRRARALGARHGWRRHHRCAGVCVPSICVASPTARDAMKRSPSEADVLGAPLEAPRRPPPMHLGPQGNAIRRIPYILSPLRVDNAIHETRLHRP